MIKFIKEMWAVYVERAKARKAVRLLTKQAWSLEFIIYVLSKATEMSKKRCHVVLRNPGGQELVVYAGAPEEQQNYFKRSEIDLDIRHEGITLQSLLDAAEVQGIL